MNSVSVSTAGVASAPGESARRAREFRAIVSLICAAFAAGAFVQVWVAPGPHPLVAGAVVAALAVAIASLQSKTIREAVSGFRFAAAMLVTLGFIAILGTLVLQGKSPELYREHFGALGGLILTLHLDDVFHSLWFGALSGLFIGSVLVSAVRRWPVSVRHAGFFACHAGLLCTLAGAALSVTYAVKGRVNLHAGADAATTAVVTRGDHTVEVPLGFSVRLDRFDVERYAAENRLGVYQTDDRGQYQLKASFDPDEGVQHRLPDGAWFRVTHYYPNAVYRDRVVSGAKGGVPALKVTTGVEESWIPAGGRYDSPDGRIAVLFDSALPMKPEPAGRHLLAAGDGPAQLVQVGQTVALGGGGHVSLLRALPHFSVDLDTKQIREQADGPLNPAVEVEIATGTGEKPSRDWLFANHPNEPTSAAGLALRYTYVANAAPPETTVRVAADGRVLVATPSGESALTYREGLAIGTTGLTLGPLYPHATRVRELAEGPGAPANPAVELELSDAKGLRTGVLFTNKPGGMSFGEGYGLSFESRADEAKTFRSAIQVANNEKTERAVVAVNSPFTFGDWTLYQVNFDPKDPTFSGLEAVHDPGVNWVFAGFALIAAGVAYMLYAEPRLRRKDQRVRAVSRAVAEVSP